MDDDSLKALYRELLARRGEADDAPPAQLEEVRALAEGRVAEAERAVQLDRVLAHPVTRREFHALRDLAEARPRSRTAPPAWLRAAAVLALVAGGTVLLRVGRDAKPEALRGEATGVRIVQPAPGAALAAGATLVWRPVVGAVDYEVAVVDGDGTTRFHAVTADTTLSVPRLGTAATLSWWIVARLADGTTVRSAPR